MPTHPYRRLGSITEFEVGQVLVNRYWSEHSVAYFRILEVSSNGSVRVVNQLGVTNNFSPSLFGLPRSWVLIEDDVPYKKARRPKSGFGLFVKAQEEKDALCPI